MFKKKKKNVMVIDFWPSKIPGTLPIQWHLQLSEEIVSSMWDWHHTRKSISSYLVSGTTAGAAGGAELATWEGAAAAGAMAIVSLGKESEDVGGAMTAAGILL